MSKAFVKETDAEADLPGKPQAIPSGVKNYMPPEGHRRMQDELCQVLRVEGPKVVETVGLGGWKRRPLGERRLHLW